MENGFRCAHDFRIHVPDAIAQQVGYMAVMQEDGKPIQLALRLKVEAGKIIEAEHVVVHKLNDGNLVNLQTPRAALVNAVPEAVSRFARPAALHRRCVLRRARSQQRPLAPFADDCVRYENGGRVGAQTGARGAVG